MGLISGRFHQAPNCAVFSLSLSLSEGVKPKVDSRLGEGFSVELTSFRFGTPSGVPSRTPWPIHTGKECGGIERRVGCDIHLNGLGVVNGS